MVTANQLQILQSPITGLISSVSTSVSVKLDETNYLHWHFMLQLLLEGHGIMGFVEGSNLCPPQYATTSAHSVLQNGSSASPESDEFKEWKMHDYALMLLLTATLSSSAISCVIGSTSSREMWVRLQNHFFFPSTKTSIIKLQTSLYNMKKGSDSISQFLRRIKEAGDGLSVLGVTLADEDFVLIALNGLPATYNTFKCVITGREGVISLENFRQQLLAEEAIMDCAPVQTQGSFFPLSSSQLYAGFNDGYHAQNKCSSCQSSYGKIVDGYNSVYKNFRFKNRGKGRLHYDNGATYKSFPHFSPGILGSPPSPYHNSLPPEITTCQICSQKGHLAAHCSTQITNSSITRDTNLQDQLRVFDSMVSVKQDYVMVNSTMKTVEQASSFGAESSQPSESAKLPTSCDSTPLLEVQRLSILHPSTRLHLVHQFAQVLADMSQEKYNAGLFLEFFVQLVVLAIWEKYIPPAAHEFRGYYVSCLCNGGNIFDIQLGYHMGICDKGGGTMNLTL